MIQNLQRTVTAVDVEKNAETKNESVLDSRMLSSVIVTSKLHQEDPAQGMDPHERLLQLMQSTAVTTLLETAQKFAQREGLPVEESLRQIVTCFRDIDQLWNQVLVKEGVSKLTSQYH